MFSPHGKQKLLLQIKLAEDQGVKDPLSSVLERNARNTARPGSQGGSRPGSRAESVRPSTTGGGGRDRGARRAGSVEAGSRERNRGGGGTATQPAVMTTSKLERLLMDPGVDGLVMKRIMESTVRYRPDRDAVFLKTFQSKHIEYDMFRHYLNVAFWLTFTDDEYFDHVVPIFDPEGAEVIDGYSFMIAFIRLGGIRKDAEAAHTRERNEYYQRLASQEEIRRRQEFEGRNQVAADFDFDEATKKAAIEKTRLAAKGYDPGHPSAPSLEAFKASHMSVAVLRETVRSAFNLHLNAKEIAAVLTYFEEKDKGGVRCN